VHAAMLRALATPEVRDGLASQGAEIFATSPEEFRKFLVQEIASTVRVIKAAQLQPE
jgi:tripartite-type tricarboxylate transporter receptor subunit TctC